jgi:hypothetical protein
MGNMKQLVEFGLENGGFISVEVEASESYDKVTRGAREELPRKAEMIFEDALDKVKPMTNAIIDKLRALSDSPDEIVVEFGLKMNAKAGAIIASVGTESNYKIMLKWIRK